MQPADKRKFLEIVNGMAAIKPGKPLTPAALDLFWNSMRRWSLDEFEQAANHLMTSVEFMPNPFHFEQLRKAGQKTAGEAWVGVLNGICTCAWQSRGKSSANLWWSVRNSSRECRT
jgi:hypothetical protein